MPEAVVEVVPEATSLDAVDTAPPDDMSAIADMVPIVSEALSPAEVETLEHYEQIIAQGIKTFVAVGQALLAIRDQRLYRQSSPTFEDYLRQRWDLVAPCLSTDGCLRGRGERVCNCRHCSRERSPGSTTHQSATRAATRSVGEVVETAPAGKVTAKHVQATVKRVKANTDHPEAVEAL